MSKPSDAAVQEHARIGEVNTLRNRRRLAMMKAGGQNSSNHPGDLMDWKVRYKRAPEAGSKK